MASASPSSAPNPCNRIKCIINYNGVKLILFVDASGDGSYANHSQFMEAIQRDEHLQGLTPGYFEVNFAKFSSS